MLIVLDEKMVPLFGILIQFAQLFANKLFKEVVDIMICFFFCQVIAVSPHLCPMSVAATLVSVGNDEGNDSDRLRNACVATLCELGNTVFL